MQRSPTFLLARALYQNGAISALQGNDIATYQEKLKEALLNIKSVKPYALTNMRASYSSGNLNYNDASFCKAAVRLASQFFVIAQRDNVKTMIDSMKPQRKVQWQSRIKSLQDNRESFKKLIVALKKTEKKMSDAIDSTSCHMSQTQGKKHDLLVALGQRIKSNLQKYMQTLNEIETKLGEIIKDAQPDRDPFLDLPESLALFKKHGSINSFEVDYKNYCGLLMKTFLLLVFQRDRNPLELSSKTTSGKFFVTDSKCSTALREICSHSANDDTSGQHHMFPFASRDRYAHFASHALSQKHTGSHFFSFRQHPEFHAKHAKQRYQRVSTALDNSQELLLTREGLFNQAGRFYNTCLNGSENSTATNERDPLLTR